MLRVGEPFRRGRIGVRVLERRRGWIPSLEDIVQRHVILRDAAAAMPISSVSPSLRITGPGRRSQFKAKLVRQLQQAQKIAARIRGTG